MEYVKGVGPKRAQLLNKLGIYSAMDLVTHYPRGHIDFTDITDISMTDLEEWYVIKAKVTHKYAPYFGRIHVFKLMVSDDTDDVLITFFNSEYNFTQLKLGMTYHFYGKITGTYLRREMNSPIFISESDPAKIKPRYHLTTGISNNILSNCIKSAIDKFSFGDELPAWILDKYKLMPFEAAIRNIHFPASKENYDSAKRSLSFRELFSLQLGLKMLKARNVTYTGCKMENKDMTGFYSSLPFSLTGAQLRSINECINDMQGNTPMNRLLQGDVGSGKTAVAAALCYYAYLNGTQSTLMAPTEILAKQHYNTLCGFLEPLGLKIELLTGSLTAAQKRKARSMIADGLVDVVVGTQALIQKDTEFLNLSLVITDEQHRFGVEQRAALSDKGNNPHILVMSATPIPRTLGMIIYGDLDISILDEMPAGRLPVKTYAVDTSFRERLYKFILKYVNNGFQAYIVCPLIEEGVSEKAYATKYAEDLLNTCLRDVPIGLLHGKMKQAEKDKVIQAFKNNEIKVLVSTTVIEVGVDVPNAVVMIIENAEQFGLSQLHQLRGRVGRGKEQSHCILVTDNKNDYTVQRMEIMKNSSDGFVIANEDLKLRGPGDFFGNRQHGLPTLKIADIYADTPLLSLTNECAEGLIKDDPTLSKPENKGIKKMVDELFSKCYSS